MPSYEQDLCIITERVWLVEAIDGGTLYWDSSSDGNTGEAVDLLHSIATGDTDPAALDLVTDKATQSNVYQRGNLAIKLFKESLRSHNPDVSGLNYLKASAALHAGLIAIESELPARLRYHNGVGFIYTAPRMFGSFVPNEGNDAQRPLSVMSFVTGESLLNPSIPRPTRRMRETVYSMALARARLNPRKVFLDRTPNNTLLAQVDERLVHVTRLDVEYSSKLPPSQL